MNALVTRLTGYHLLDPGLLWLALLPFAALVLRRALRAPAARFGPATFLAGLPVGLRQRLAGAPPAIAALGLVLLVVAVARPVERDPVPPSREGIDILLCLDTSSSMAAKDLDPERSRLAVAREAAASFVAGRPDDRIGLVSFARFPDVRCPLTLDHRALARILADVELVLTEGPEDATGMGTAVGRAAQVLAGSEAPSRVVILLTDGEENVATRHTPGEIAPLHAGQLCQRLGVRVYAVAAGLGERTASGDWVEIDTSQVRTLAERTGGRFFEARDADALSEVYDEIDALERVEQPEPRFRLIDRFTPFLLLGLALLALARVLSATVLAVRP